MARIAILLTLLCPITGKIIQLRLAPESPSNVKTEDAGERGIVSPCVSVDRER